MAWMNQETKQRIAERVRAVTPKTWRVTFSVRHRSTLICTIRKADVDILGAISDAYEAIANANPRYDFSGRVQYIQSLGMTTIEMLPDPLRSTLKAMHDALESENYDRSDIMTDYFDVGYYAHLAVGDHTKMLEVLPAPATLARG